MHVPGNKGHKDGSLVYSSILSKYCELRYGAAQELCSGNCTPDAHVVSSYRISYRESLAPRPVAHVTDLLRSLLCLVPDPLLRDRRRQSRARRDLLARGGCLLSTLLWRLVAAAEQDSSERSRVVRGPVLTKPRQSLKKTVSNVRSKHLICNCLPTPTSYVTIAPNYPPHKRQKQRTGQLH